MKQTFEKQNWIVDKTTVYSLHQVGWNKGEPIMSNKFYFQVYPDYRIENAQEKAEEIAKRMAAADDMLELFSELTNYIQGVDFSNMVVLKIPMSLSQRIGKVIEKATKTN